MLEPTEFREADAFGINRWTAGFRRMCLPEPLSASLARKPRDLSRLNSTRNGSTSTKAARHEANPLRVL